MTPPVISPVISPALSPVTDIDTALAQIEARRQARAALKDRHSQGLTRLMETRNDLRGVHALADFVDDAIRWTA